MKTYKGKIEEDFYSDIYWVIIVFKSDDESKRTRILAATSNDYLRYFYKISPSKNLEQKHLEEWEKGIIKKWSVLGDEIFDYNNHYDTYFTNEEGEAKGLAFLRSKTKQSV